MKKEIAFSFIIVMVQLAMFFIIAFLLILKAFPPENEKILYLIMGNLISQTDNAKGLVNTVKDYYFGSSVKPEKTETKPEIK
jgi:hypothetical protein